MSGVYIPGMEMPTDCSNCELAQHFDGYNENECPFNAFSFHDCPMIEVPDHGRLIDAEAFREEMNKHYPFDKFTQSEHGVADVAKGTILLMLADASIIIPADKEVDNG